MADLDYTPSAPARSLKGGRSKLLGVLIPNTNNPIYNLYIDGIKDTAYAAGYGVLTFKTGSDHAGESQSLRVLYEQRVAGAIITTPSWREHIPRLTQAGIALVTIDARASAADSVSLDNLSAMAKAVGRLAGLGHRQIGIVTGPLDIVSERERLIGYRRALRRARLSTERGWQGIARGFEDVDAIGVVGPLLTGGHRPSALIVSSSNLTPGVLVAAARAELRIPEDLAVIGFGDLSWTPSLVSPITSLVEPAYEMGVQACALLFERIAGRFEGPARRLYHQARLVVRRSCGAPAEAHDASTDSPSLTFFSQVASHRLEGSGAAGRCGSAGLSEEVGAADARYVGGDSSMRPGDHVGDTRQQIERIIRHGVSLDVQAHAPDESVRGEHGRVTLAAHANRRVDEREVAEAGEE